MKLDKRELSRTLDENQKVIALLSTLHTLSVVALPSCDEKLEMTYYNWTLEVSPSSHEQPLVVKKSDEIWAKYCWVDGILVFTIPAAGDKEKSLAELLKALYHFMTGLSYAVQLEAEKNLQDF